MSDAFMNPQDAWEQNHAMREDLRRGDAPSRETPEPETHIKCDGCGSLVSFWPGWQINRCVECNSWVRR